MKKIAGSDKSCPAIAAMLCERCKARVPDEEMARKQSDFFKALSDPVRVRIVYALSEGDLCNCHLMKIMDMPQTAISHHMKVLKHAGIVKDRRSGKWINYTLTDRKALEALGLTEK